MNDPNATDPTLSDIGDLESLIAAMAPPTTVNDALGVYPEIQERYSSQSLFKLVGALAGLSTEPQFQSMHVRLDWATRFALTLSRGKRSLRTKEINRLLNSDMASAQIDRLEDPIESPFIERIPTSYGDFHLITGLWESAGFHTECVLRAFEGLPAHEIRDKALSQAYSLLKLADEIARRCGAPANRIGGGSPGRQFISPTEARLRKLSRRVRFSLDDLRELGIDQDELRPFLLPLEATEHLEASPPGNSPLEFMPLLPEEGGFLVASPHNLTTAVRGHLIVTAAENNMRDGMRAELLEVHGDMMEVSGFVSLPPAQFRKKMDQIWREVVWEESSGYWVHTLQLVDDLNGWPHAAFGSVFDFGKSSAEALNDALQRARQFCSEQPGFREGLTLCIVGGVGRGLAISDDIELDTPSWQSLVLSPSDAFVMGVLDDGKFEDIWRLAKIEKLTEEAGFQIQNMSGPLNLFQWWRDNELKLVPEHQVDITPPVFLNFDTNLLLQSRISAATAMDLRTTFHPELGQRRITRKSRSVRDESHDLIYVDVDADDARIPRAAILFNQIVWWIELKVPKAGSLQEVDFRTWDAFLHWAAKCLRHVASQFDFPEGVTCFDLTIDPTPDANYTDPPSTDLADCVELDIDEEKRKCSIRLLTDWHKYLFRADNLAERHVAGRFIEGFMAIENVSTEAANFVQLALAAVGSTSYRWRHVSETSTPIERLKALQLAGKFRPIPKSAGALVQFGTCWEIRDRESGALIEGKNECVEYLEAYYNHLLIKLIEKIRFYERCNLIAYALSELQAAEGELSHWSMTASAMRAIHGEEGDQSLSIDQKSKAYGVIRASSLIAEVGLSEAREDGKSQAGNLDFAELQALALMVFEIGDLLAGMRLNRIEPRIHISPTGEVLSNHEFEEQTVKKSGQKVNLKNRQADASRYKRRFEDHEADDLSPEFQQAVAAEFAAPWQAVMDLGVATTDLAAQRQQGVFLAQRSEILSELADFDSFREIDIAPLLDRLTQSPRSSWYDLPDGWVRNDIDLARLGRRYAPISRPIMAVNSEIDPMLAICPAAIFRSLMFMLSGAMNGSLQNEYWSSREMRHYSSDAGRKAGLRFDKRVAESVAEFGLDAHPSVKPSWCLNMKNTDDVKRLGDIDTLAVDHTTNTVWVIEAKDVQLCRTMGEAARRLSEYQGKADDRGRPDKLLRHLNRVRFIRDHSANLTTRLDLRDNPTVKGLVVIRSPQPIDDVWTDVGEDARVVMLDHLSEFFG